MRAKFHKRVMDVHGAGGDIERKFIRENFVIGSADRRSKFLQYKAIGASAIEVAAVQAVGKLHERADAKMKLLIGGVHVKAVLIDANACTRWRRIGRRLRVEIVFE